MQYTVNSTDIQSAAVSVTAHASAVRDQVHAMMGKLDTLQNTWSGRAAAAFTQCSQRWYVVQQQVEQTLEEISQALKVAAQQYEDAESHTELMFQS
ncbi:MAG: WXG100 family type VII secretion target [Bowdeniella nasicola]|nr:WXG100 family type VII secretion target [Bowdeniella nasicola]